MRYPWLDANASIRPLDETFTPPPGFTRVDVAERSFGAWLRRLPLRDASAPVLSYRGAVLRPADGRRVAAVAELDVGEQDLQQCADSVIRLHAEWLWASGRPADIRYHATSGDLAVWSRYAAGERPASRRRRCAGAPRASGHLPPGLPALPRHRFRIRGHRLARPARGEALTERRRAGDFFVLPGSPGHAVLVLDMARDAEGRTVALLGQGFMPAQDFHVLSTPSGPWYSLDVDAVDTPFWPAPFPWTALRRLQD